MFCSLILTYQLQSDLFAVEPEDGLHFITLKKCISSVAATDFNYMTLDSYNQVLLISYLILLNINMLFYIYMFYHSIGLNFHVFKYIFDNF